MISSRLFLIVCLSKTLARRLNSLLPKIIRQTKSFSFRSTKLETHKNSHPSPQRESYDFVVVGSGAAGMAAAVFAAAQGQSVLVVEKSAYIGGTSAFTAGTAWVPATRGALQSGASQNDAEQARLYLTGLSGKPLDDPMIDSYLGQGAEAIAYLEDQSEVEFEVRELHPDYFSQQAGSSLGYRALEAETYSNNRSRYLRRLRPQNPELTVFGGMMLSRTDIPRLAKIARSPLAPSTWPEYFLATRLLLNHLLSKALYRRPTRFTMGNALVARLAASLEKLNVEVLTDTIVSGISKSQDTISAITIQTAGGSFELQLNKALISATGGFNRNLKRRTRLLPQVPEQWSAVAESVSGEFHSQLDTLGARFEESASGAFFAPVSLAPRKDGSHGVYPHFAMDRGKPGFIVVDQSGKRYQNEAMSYNHFSQQMLKHGNEALPSWLITDRTGFKKFGIGVIRPGGWGMRRRLKDGYLVRADSIQSLAQKLEIPSNNLLETIQATNSATASGTDDLFQRGETAYEKNLGDAKAGKNPNLGTIQTGPYYAIRLYPGDIASTSGYKTTVFAQAVDEQEAPIPGLYIIGNDMRSIMGDVYPGPGITLGPGIVFAYTAVNHALGKQ
ncbi:MAG: FAD-dependent oxidoreductase [Microbacteriaceae bacterium]